MIKAVNNINFGIVPNKKLFQKKDDDNLGNNLKNGDEGIPLDANKSNALNPQMPGDFIDETDLKRYKNIQRQWSENFAQRYGIPLKNVMARLPEIEFGDAGFMLSKNLIAYFDSNENIIKLNPIRELYDVYKDDQFIAHESTHAYLYNIRRAWAKNLTAQELSVLSLNTVLNSIRDGETRIIIKGFKRKKMSGRKDLQCEFMYPPQLSDKEREATINVIKALNEHYVDIKNMRLNKYGEDYVKKNLIPLLDEYSEQFDNVHPLKRKKSISQNIINYINAYFARANILFSSLSSTCGNDAEVNLKTPLSQAEIDMAKESIKGILPTVESNAANQDLIVSKIENANANYSYFLSYEEMMARKEETIFRYNVADKKISDLLSKGFSPSRMLLKDKNAAQNNYRLLELLNTLNEVDQQIDSAKKEPKEIANISVLRHEINKLKDFKYSFVMSYMTAKYKFLPSLKSEDLFEFIKNNLPKQFKSYKDEFCERLKRIMELDKIYQETNIPSKLLQNNPQNTELINKRDEILKQIKALTPQCDFVAIPRVFYKSDEDFDKANAQIRDCLNKWRAAYI